MRKSSALVLTSILVLGGLLLISDIGLLGTIRLVVITLVVALLIGTLINAWRESERQNVH